MVTYCSQDRFYRVSPGKLLFKKPQKNKSESTVATLSKRSFSTMTKNNARRKTVQKGKKQSIKTDSE